MQETLGKCSSDFTFKRVVKKCLNMTFKFIRKYKEEMSQIIQNLLQVECCFIVGTFVASILKTLVFKLAVRLPDERSF
jgi:hypothetical protein